MEKLRVFIAEDDHEDFYLMKSILDKRKDVSYKRFLTGVALLENLPFLDLPDLILLDLKMPILNGLEVLQQLKNSSYRYIPVIIMTSTEQESDIYNSYYNGAASYIQKPLTEEGLDLIVHYWLKLSRLPNKNAA